METTSATKNGAETALTLQHQQILADAEAARVTRAARFFADLHPDLSAHKRTTPLQTLLIVTLLAVLAAGLYTAPVRTFYALGTALNLVFVFAILLRFYAALHLRKTLADRVATIPVQGVPGASDLPVYSILVPLYREERVVGALIEHLRSLDYPADRLDIKLIFEASDTETLAAARAMNPPAHFEFVVIPSAQPRTKPKALNYALESIRGTFVVVYDAEDRPAPDQLRKAVAVFDVAGEKVACLQAALGYYNAGDNWLTRQAAIEYASLFLGLLPALQQLRLPIPLGGTSNHFRASVLREIGGWDAFNVTEDADIGMRLCRFGYRCEMLPSTTAEEACWRPRDWLRQRTRWIKGWLQTYLVHMRNPVLLWRQLGAHGFFGFQIVLGAQVLALLAHPVYIVFMASEAVRGQLFDDPEFWFGRFFWGLALGNFAFGYLTAIWLGAATLRRSGARGLLPHLAFMPVYWLAISLAAFRAVVEFVRRPFHWEKTEHGLCRGAVARKTIGRGG